MGQDSAGQHRRGPGGHLLESVRFEIIPTSDALERAQALPRGAAVTVTASPRHGPEATVALAESLAARGFAAVPHLAARHIADETELAGFLARLHAAGIGDLFVVGGDSPAPAGVFPDGLTLLKAIDAAGYRFGRVGVPTYPEGHPHIDDDTLWDALAAKRYYATYTVTQMCFDAAAIARHISSMARRGITLATVVGIPGPVPVAKLLRMGLRIGVGDSLRFASGNRSFTRAFLRPRGYRPEALLREISARAAEMTVPPTGLHLYTFNETAAAARWLDGRPGAQLPPAAREREGRS